MALLADGVSSLFIDGKLSEGSAGTFPTVNPATEEVLGVAAAADAADMGRAIEAARRAFDDTDWSRNAELRVRCVRQLRDAMREHIEELRQLTISEVGAPRMLTAAAQLEGPVNDLAFAADTAESYSWHQDLGQAAPLGIPTRRTLAREAVGVVGAITPWNFPHQINLAKLGRRWPRATPSYSNLHRTHRGVGPCSARSSPTTPTFRPEWSTSSPPATTAWARCLPKTLG
ncbi:aldehyde dehydrogenase family protein [Mycobacterium kansasii]|uniref:Aldehyde dehydrogenase family protein n=1 Tax=Mycobacterium kansasii TaxID=1768 RepID=A0A1V3WUA5_MYCKA|nr:aldehyde dehydrogenase family protein [Mycobacterium kansasii]